MAPAQVTDFNQLYAQNCAGCHGSEGRFGSARPLNDPLYLAVANADVLRQVTAKGVPGTAMPAFAKQAGGSLTDKQIDALVEGMRSRWGRPKDLKMWRFRPTACKMPLPVAQVLVTHRVERRFSELTVPGVMARMAAAARMAAPSWIRTSWRSRATSHCARRRSPADRTSGSLTGGLTCLTSRCRRKTSPMWWPGS